MTGTGVADLLAEGVARGFFAGAAAAVSGDPGTHTFFAGRARVVPEAVDASAETLWDLASLTKPLAGAALALRLAAARQIELDDEVKRFGDAWKKTKFDGVTVRRLLAHTSGAAAWFPCYVRGEGRAAYRKTLAALEPDGPPGARATYSCLGYLLLADVVEHVASASLDAFFRTEVAAPLGLERDLLFAPAGADAARAAGGEGDDATERRMVAERGLSYAGFRHGVASGEANDGNAYRRGAGVSLNAGLFGTVTAVAAIAEAWRRADDRLAPVASIREAVTDATGVLRAGRGLGWEAASATNAAGPSLSEDSYGHTGFTGTSVWVDPRRRRTFVLLANRLHPAARDVDMNAFRRRFHAAAAAVA